MSALNTYVATTSVLQLRLRIDHRTNVAVIWFWYKRTMGKIRAYHRYGYGRTTGTATGVPQTRLWAYHRHGYGRTTDMATGVLRLRLRANVRAYYVNFFTAYTVLSASDAPKTKDDLLQRWPTCPKGYD